MTIHELILQHYNTNNTHKTNIYSNRWNDFVKEFGLFFTIGLPRSGKTTFANFWEKKPKDIVICGDEFRQAVYGPEPYKDGCDVQGGNGECAVSMAILTTLRTFYNRKYRILFDETNSTEWSIRRIFEIDRNAQYIIIPTPLEVCLARTQNDNIGLRHAIHRINNNLKTLDVEKIRKDYL